MIKKHKGQVVITLILLVTVVLAIGLALVQRSLFDISTATKIEQSQQAFSAAEAAIEKTLKENTSSTVSFPETGAQGTSEDTGLLPSSFTCNISPCPIQRALEYPPLAKEEIAHVWLANPDSTSNPPEEFFDPPSGKRTLDIYWGDPSNIGDQPAIQIKILYADASNNYYVQSYYLDPDSGRVTPATNFTAVTCSSYIIDTILGDDRPFYCKWTTPQLLDKLMLLRVRLLFNSSSHQFAVVPTDTTCAGCYIPPQVRIIFSTGTSGETERRIQVFQEKKVVPPYFDYAIFSAGEIRK